MDITRNTIEKFQKKIFRWWRKNKRDFPWRKTNTPYHILVSEIMLQQTQTFRVLPAYISFLQQFPTVEILAQSSPAQVIRRWKSLGYNRRAVFLLRSAKIVSQQYNGILPSEEKDLLGLPGIGKYTARAVQIFAYHKDTVAIDTNIRKILIHYFFPNRQSSEKELEAVAFQLLPYGKSWQWHQALMDYGAIHMPKNQERTKKKKYSIPFIQSPRYFRGKIIDLLREKKMPEKNLIEELIKRFNRSEDFFNKVISSLIRDSLIEKKGSIFQLPE